MWFIGIWLYSLYYQNPLVYEGLYTVVMYGYYTGYIKAPCTMYSVHPIYRWLWLYTWLCYLAISNSAFFINLKNGLSNILYCNVLKKGKINTISQQNYRVSIVSYNNQAYGINIVTIIFVFSIIINTIFNNIGIINY